MNHSFQMNDEMIFESRLIFNSSFQTFTKFRI